MSSAGNRGIISNNAGYAWNAPKDTAAATADAGSTAERRRSSAASAQKFANLHNQKRNSQDANAAARKASFAEQRPPPGFFGSLWQGWTRGK